MIEINLLPKELKKKQKRIEIPKIKFIPIIVGVVIAIFFIHSILIMTFAIKKHSIKRLEAKWSVLEPKREEILIIKKQINNLNNRIKDVETLKAERILWAKKLNDLSDSIMPSIWLTSLSFEEESKRKYLSLKGAVSSFGGDEAAMIGRFMKALKENKSFFEDFDEIKLGTIQQKKVNNTEVMDFSINCYFKTKK